MSGEQRKFELSMPQIVGSALAAVTAAVAASYLGVAGTVIGAAVVSVATTVGSAIYTHYLKRTGEQVKLHTVIAWRDPEPPGTTSEQRDTPGPGDPDAPESGETTLVMPRAERPGRPLPWLKMSMGASLVFAVSMGAILAYQGISGSRVDEQTRGAKDPAPAVHHKAPAKQDDPATRAPAYTPATKTPGPTPTPTPTPTPAKTPTKQPTTPTPSGSPQVDPSVVPSDGPTSIGPTHPDTQESPPVDQPEQDPGTP